MLETLAHAGEFVDLVGACAVFVASVGRVLPTLRGHRLETAVETCLCCTRRLGTCCPPRRCCSTGRRRRTRSFSCCGMRTPCSADS
ncbi:DUF6192 family protein [Actinosynnema sp. ALI-1.44]|uniref:DUF6192 family protein n=1 Tax=Actinosynnema sp. ALI-1.44 TaxID=1933779 RepID=UPI003F8D0B46